MEVIEKKNQSFYTIDQGGKVTFSNLGVIEVLSEAGFCRLKVSEKQIILVRIVGNKIYYSSPDELIQYLRDHILESSQKVEVMELLIERASSLVQKFRLNFLEEICLVSDMDDSESSRFFFTNKIMKVTKDQISEVEYSQLEHPIWSNRVLSHAIKPRIDKKGQFEFFCFKISGSCEKKLKQLQSCIGYLLHRHKNPALTKAVILYDNKMKETGLAEGGTGKTLIWIAIQKCREVIDFNGKKIKSNSNFQYQKINTTTDVMAYDDVQSSFDFDSLYALLTTGIEIERKNQDAFDIPYERSPKVIITSNTYVKGTGGSSDRRRRYEFTLANFFSDKYSPRNHFKNNLFDDWDDREWNLFFYFMMDSVQVFLNHGLIEDKHESQNERLQNLTHPHFVEAVETLCEIEEWVTQKEFLSILNDELLDLSPHMFTKWMKIYCSEKDLQFTKRNSGGVFSFKISIQR